MIKNPTRLPLPESAGQLWATGHDVAADTSNGWRAVPSWGRDGYDLGSWPLVVVMHRDDPKNSNSSYAVLTYVEGDIDVEQFPTREERDARTDAIAEFYWRHEGAEWLDGIPEGRLPGHLRGPFSWARLDSRGGAVLTAARGRGLEACFRSAGYVARRSNETDVAYGYCYWQTADWLVAHGYARLEDGIEYVRLTEAGVELARAERGQRDQDDCTA